jgi:saccharopine dehydrogenase-like NADP-dependent oxidoreductase
MRQAKVVILGGGMIGRAVAHFIEPLNVEHQIWDANPASNDIIKMDVAREDMAYLATQLMKFEATHVINCLPFFLNVKAAEAAYTAKCSYIDFTEDDVMADKVQAIYASAPEGIHCAVKCGLAPGFINYLGHSLVRKFDTCTDLTIAVGALPRNVNFMDGSRNYNLSWSVDGLVNEYIRPSRIRRNGQEMEVQSMTGHETVIADGVTYEMAYTAGGIGSLVKELKKVPNVGYKTLRYPGHYRYVADVVARNNRDFDKIKADFLKAFPYNRDDVIVVYAEAKGQKNGVYTRETYSNRFVGAEKCLTGIQSTTAGGGIAILELMLQQLIPQTVVNHQDIPFDLFTSTKTFQKAYKEI